MRENYNAVRKRRPMSLRVKERLLYKKKAAVKVKKVTKTAEKKNNRKDKKTDYSTVINKVEEDIVLFFQDIDYGDPNKVEA